MRAAEIERNTGETNVKVMVTLDGTGDREIDTGVGFLDHMLTLLAVHGGIDLTVAAKGDLNVDAHHTVEDVGIALGKALRAAFGDRKGIARYGFFRLPMDEALAEVALDVSGRPYLVYRAPGLRGEAGGFDFSLLEEFFRAVAFNAGLTLHVEVPYGANLHHMAEAVFKGFARSLRAAKAVAGEEIPSSKGTLD